MPESQLFKMDMYDLNKLLNQLRNLDALDGKIQLLLDAVEQSYYELQQLSANGENNPPPQTLVRNVLILAQTLKTCLSIIENNDNSDDDELWVVSMNKVLKKAIKRCGINAAPQVD